MLALILNLLFDLSLGSFVVAEKARVIGICVGLVVGERDGLKVVMNRCIIQSCLQPCLC